MSIEAVAAICAVIGIAVAGASQLSLLRQKRDDRPLSDDPDWNVKR